MNQAAVGSGRTPQLSRLFRRGGACRVSRRLCHIAAERLGLLTDLVPLHATKRGNGVAHVRS